MLCSRASWQQLHMEISILHILSRFKFSQNFKGDPFLISRSQTSPFWSTVYRFVLFKWITKNFPLEVESKSPLRQTKPCQHKLYALNKNLLRLHKKTKQKTKPELEMPDKDVIRSPAICEVVDSDSLWLLKCLYAVSIGSCIVSKGTLLISNSKKWKTE